MFCWLTNPKYLVLANWVVAFGSMAAAGVALWIATVGYRREEWRRRRNDSTLGATIMESLLEEVRTGLGIMQDTLQRIEARGKNPVPVPRAELPWASWERMSTIPDNVLLRIIATADKVEPRGFPPSQVRIHCKNYFVHMRRNFNNCKYDADLQPLLSSGERNGDYIGLTRRIIDMLEQAKELLEENARRRLPK